MLDAIFVHEYLERLALVLRTVWGCHEEKEARGCLHSQILGKLCMT